MVYLFEGFVRRHKDGRFVESPCVNPEHEPWALVHALMDSNTGQLFRTCTIFITDGINVINVRSDGFQAYSVSDRIPCTEERQKVLEAFAKGMLDD